MMVDKIVLFSVCLIMMEALRWIMPIGAAIVIAIFIVLEFVKGLKPKSKRKPSKPKIKPKMLSYDGSYYRKR